MNDNTIFDKYKVCSRCKKSKPFNNDFFAKDNRSRSGLRSSCKECNNAYRNRNKKAINEYNSKYHSEKREEISTRKKIYYEENKELILERTRAYGLVYRANNKVNLLEYQRKYKAKNRTKFNVYKQRRRAMKKMLPYTLTIEEWEEVKATFDYKCVYCGIDKDLHQDHFIALSKGGGYTKKNILPSCQSCNSSKGDKDFVDWYRSNANYSKGRKNKILEYIKSIK